MSDARALNGTGCAGDAGDAFQETADRLSRAAAAAKESLDKETLDRLALMMRRTPDERTIKMIPGRI